STPGRQAEAPAPRREQGLCPAGPLTPAEGGGAGALPEEVVDHVDHFAGVDVHQQRIVVVAHPAVRAVGIGQAVLPRIVDPVAAAEEQAVEEVAGAHPAIAVVPVRRVIDADMEHAAVGVAMALPVVAAVIAPVVVPAAVIVAVVAAPVVAAIVLPAAAFRPPVAIARGVAAIAVCIGISAVALALADRVRPAVALPLDAVGALVAA